MRRSSPTSRHSMSVASEIWATPCTTASGAWSPPMASTAMVGALGVGPSNHGERGERAGEREREAQRRPTRCGARDARRELVAAGGRSEQPSGSAAAAALPRIVLRSRHDYSDSLLDGDQDRVALERHLVTLDALALVHRVAARGHVVLPAVPRAGDDHALELALPERPATVEAGVVDGVERAAHVEERDLLAARLDALARSGRDVADGGDFHEGRHGAASGTRPGTGQDASAAAMGGSAPRRSSHSPTAPTWSTSRASA